MVQVNMLWGIRKSDPETPELMEAWDEYSIDSNDDGWVEAQEKAIASWGDELAASIVVTIDIPHEALLTALNPPKPRLAVVWTNEQQFKER